MISFEKTFKKLLNEHKVYISATINVHENKCSVLIKKLRTTVTTL